jgi:hypothetical protein
MTSFQLAVHQVAMMTMMAMMMIELSQTNPDKYQQRAENLRSEFQRSSFC